VVKTKLIKDFYF